MDRNTPVGNTLTSVALITRHRVFNRISILRGIIFGMLLLSACSSSTSPSPGGFNGRWSGSIGSAVAGTAPPAQETPITIVVANNHITEITAGYRSGICTGTKVFSNLSVQILPNTPSIPLPFPNPPPPPNALFTFESGAPGAPGHIQVAGAVSEAGSAVGTILWNLITECGDPPGFETGSYWNATR
jgi:hypothetical protein